MKNLYSHKAVHITNIIVVFFLFNSFAIFSQVGINTVSTDPSAALDLTSTDKGFLPPRMTTVQRNAISSPASGLVIYNTTTNVLNFYDGSAWQSFGGSYLDLTTNQTATGGVKTFNGTIVPVGRLDMPMGEVSFFNFAGTNQVITNTYTTDADMVPVTAATTLLNVSGFDNGGANDGVLRYTGAITKMFHVAVTISGTPQTASDVYVFAIAINGVVQTGGKVTGSSSGTQFASFHAMPMLSTNDELQFYIGNLSSSGDFVLKSVNIFAWGM